MSLSEHDVINILRLIEASDFESFQLEYGDIKLAVSKSEGLLPQFSQAPTQPIGPGSALATISEATVANNGAEPVAAAQKPAQVLPSSLVAVEAPVVGVFYAAPEPGAEPFIRLGSQVDTDTTVGLIEVMKIFNAVPSGVKGKVVEVCVEDAQLVEYGQPLFMIEPE